MPTVSKGLYRWLWKGGATLEDAADRLNHIWTVGLLLILGVVISWKQGYSQPVICWCPAHFTDAYVEYTQSRAWYANKILPNDLDKLDRAYSPLPTVRNEYRDGDYDKPVVRTFYQWVPLVMCLQALLFKLPNVLMYVMHGYSGVSFDKVSGLTSGFETLNIADRGILSRQMARYIRSWSSSSLLAGMPFRFLTMIWLLVKLLFVINVIVQLTMVNNFLWPAKTDNATDSYGDVIINNLREDNASFWRESPAFPRQFHFDFSIQFLSNVHKYSVTCFIPANFFAEKVYMFLWIWFVFVAVVSGASLLVRVLKSIVPLRRRYIRKYLEMSEEVPGHRSEMAVNKFADSFLGEDGTLVLKLIEANSSELIVMQVVANLWATNGEPSTGYTFVPSQPTAPIYHPPQGQPYVQGPGMSREGMEMTQPSKN